MKKISVILPIHNVSQYLGEALDSLINQTIGIENLEVIMVDDHSTDECPEIIKKYIEEYPDFKSITLDETSGAAGKPRNEGIKIATSPYIMFLDPDDLYDKDACLSMYNAITKANADIVTANYMYMDDDGTIWDKPVFDKKRFKNFDFGMRSFRDSYFIWNSAVWNKIFKKSLIDKYNINFLEGVPGEDAYFSYASLLKSKKVRYISDVIYYYRRRNSADNPSVSWDRNADFFRKMNFVYRKVYELFKESKKLEQYRYFYAKTMTSILYKIIDTKSLNDEEKADIYKEMQWFFTKRKYIKVDPCQKNLNIILEKVDNEEYAEAVKISKVVQELRGYIPDNIKEGMSKPENINYVEV